MKKFIKAVIITTIFSVITRALGLLIKIYISRKIGAEALGYYQIALSVFFLLCTLVTSGIPLVISRMIANNPKPKSKIVFSGLVVSTLISVVVCAFVILFPKVFTKIWGQSSSLSVLFALLPAILFTGFYVPFRGAFWGSKDFFMLGFVELVEQIIRFAALFIFFNLSLGFSGEQVAGITYSLACALSSIFAIIIYFVKGGKLSPSIKTIKPILAESAPIALSRIGSSAVSLIISIVLPAILINLGSPQNQAIGEFGIVTGMVMPILTIPGTLISSIAVAIIPELSGASPKSATRQINQAISYSIIISFLLFPAFLTIGEPLGILLFNEPLAGELLKIGSVLLLPMGLSQITSSILNAINKEKIGLINYLVGAIGMIIAIVVLPKFMGIFCLIAGFFIMSIITTLLNMLVIKNHLNSSALKTLGVSVLFCVPACLLGAWSYSILIKFFANIFAITISTGMSVLTLAILYQTFKFINVTDFLPTKLKRHA